MNKIDCLNAKLKSQILTYVGAFIFSLTFLGLGLNAHYTSSSYAENSCQVAIPGLTLTLWLNGVAMQEVFFSLILLGAVFSRRLLSKFEVVLALCTFCFLFSMMWSLGGAFLLFLNIYCFPTFLYLVCVLHASIPWIIFHIGKCLVKKIRK